MLLTSRIYEVLLYVVGVILTAVVGTRYQISNNVLSWSSILWASEVLSDFELPVYPNPNPNPNPTIAEGKNLLRLKLGNKSDGQGTTFDGGGDLPLTGRKDEDPKVVMFTYLAETILTLPSRAEYSKHKVCLI